MNQNDQIQHDEERLEQLYWEFDKARKQSGEERWHFKGFMRGYAAHVNETPKSEHDSDDVLIKAGNVNMMREALQEAVTLFKNMREYPDEIQWHLKAEQALNHTPDTGKIVDHIGDANKMVRLTEEDIQSVFDLHMEGRLMVNYRLFANAIMDAMIAKNAPRERLTREHVQPIIERLGKVSDHGWTFSDMALMALISEIEDLIRNEQ